MAVQTPPSRPITEFEVDAGVVKDARVRQQRHRAVAAMLIAIAAGVGLLVLGGSGGGGSGAAKSGRGNGSSPNSAAHTTSQVGVGVAFAPPTIGASGLLSPGVGWAVNGLGFYMTWDGGRLWSDVHVPELGGDVLADFMAASSPSSRTLVLAIGDGGSSYGTCADPAGSASRAIGDLAVSSDAGRTWRTFPFPDCRVAIRISFINAQTGFAVSAGWRFRTPEVLYNTVDGGRSWHRIADLPEPGPIDFTSTQAGWLLGANQIYRTSDGGKRWQRASVCRQPANRTVTLVCGPTHFFGAKGAVETTRAVAGVGLADSASVSTTTNDGLSWSAHKIAVSQRVQGYLASPMSAASPEDLFVYFQGGVMAKSTDAGRSWRQLAAPQFKGGAAINFTNAHYGWIQDGGSLYATSDDGQHWHRMKQIGNQPPTP
jgi:photosystem II stability/assembly factor-like uncharacterized protein